MEEQPARENLKLAVRTPETEFIKIEKNLAGLGFFTPPSSKKAADLRKPKTVTFTRVEDGKRITVSATIVPETGSRLPTTADQDKYLAFQTLVMAIKARDGVVNNPVAFTSSELLALLGQTDAGNNYRDVSAWLDVMSSTNIRSNGVVYFKGRRRWMRDRFRVFDRAVSFGKELEPGRIAEKNYVWLSTWQLENINHNYLLPIELGTYRQLHNSIARAMVPLLQIWLYASRESGCFRKRYEALCEILSIRRQTRCSHIRRQLGPSLDELVKYHYLRRWELDDGDGFRIVLYHGDKFHRDRRARLASRAGVDGDLEPIAHDQPIGEDELVEELVRRGVTRITARKVLAQAGPDQPVLDQLEWGDHVIEKGSGQIQNPPGFFVHLIRENVPVPAGFWTTLRRQEAAEDNDKRSRAVAEQYELEHAYYEARAAAIDSFIENTMTIQQYRVQMEAERKRLFERFPRADAWPKEALERYLEQNLREVIAVKASVPSLAEFTESRRRVISIAAERVG